MLQLEILLITGKIQLANHQQHLITYATFLFKPQEVNNIDELTHKHNKALKFTLINQPTFYIYNDRQ